MAIVSIGNLKSRLENGDQPDEQVFIDLLDSLRHVSANIPAAEVTGLAALISNAVGNIAPSSGDADLQIVTSDSGVTIRSGTGDPVTISAATLSAIGLFLPSEKSKLSGIQEGATADQTGPEIVSLLTALSGESRLPSSAIRDLDGVGIQGPAGPAGPAGPQGPQGPAGSGAASTQRISLHDATGITVDIQYSGTTPTVSGSNGNYTITIPVGCVWSNFHVDAPITASATNVGEFTLSIVNQSGVRDWSNTQLTEYGDYEEVEYYAGGVVKTQTPAGADRIVHNWTNLTGLTGFGIFFNR